MAEQPVEPGVRRRSAPMRERAEQRPEEHEESGPHDRPVAVPLSRQQLPARGVE